MEVLLQITGSLASICSIPLSVYFFIISREKRNAVVREEICSSLYTSIASGKGISMFEVESFIKSIARKQKVDENKVSRNAILEELVIRVHNDQLLTKAKRNKAIGIIEGLYLELNDDGNLQKIDNSKFSSSTINARETLRYYMLIPTGIIFIMISIFQFQSSRTNSRIEQIHNELSLEMRNNGFNKKNAGVMAPASFREERDRMKESLDSNTILKNELSNQLIRLNSYNPTPAILDSIELFMQRLNVLVVERKILLREYEKLKEDNDDFMKKLGKGIESIFSILDTDATKKELDRTEIINSLPEKNDKYALKNIWRKLVLFSLIISIVATMIFLYDKMNLGKQQVLHNLNSIKDKE